MRDISHQIPYQVQQLLDSLVNKKDSHILRSNYRMRLDTIRREIDAAIRQYDSEGIQDNKRKA